MPLSSYILRALGWKIWTYDIQGVFRGVFLPRVWCFLLVYKDREHPSTSFLEDRKHLRTLSLRVRNSVGMFLPPVFQIRNSIREVFVLQSSKMRNSL